MVKKKQIDLKKFGPSKCVVEKSYCYIKNMQNVLYIRTIKKLNILELKKN